MNTTVTSRGDILRAAKTLALAQGTAELNMRSLAHACGISVGSIYNYFPTKSDLMIAVVAEIWQEIFHPSLCQGTADGFLALVDRFSHSIRTGIAAYPGFFGSHAMVIDDKAQGREAMERYFHHMELALCQALLADPAVRADVWSEGFPPEAFAAFVFDFLRTDLLRGRDRSAFLKDLILRAIY